MTALITRNSGYIGSPIKWKVFLTQAISTEFFDKRMAAHDDINLNQFKSEIKGVLAADSTLKPQKIEKLQKNIGVNPPKSFIDFLQVDGIALFNQLSFLCFIYVDLLSVKKIKPYAAYSKRDLKFMLRGLNYSDKAIVRDNYYSYNSYQHKIDAFNGFDNMNLASRDMVLGELSFGFLPEKKDDYKQAITLDEDKLSSVLMMPTERTADGEMETWMLEDSDIYRFRSFAEFFVANMFFDHEIPECMTPVEYLTLHGVHHILDFDVLKATAVG